MITTVITGDIHARHAKARELFERIGMISCPTDDPVDDERQPGFTHVQLGDAVSLGYGELEAEFYRWLFDTVGVDVALLGNHELPSVWWHPNAVMFQGYYDRAEVRRELDHDLPTGTGMYWAQQYPWKLGRDRAAEALVRERYAAGGYRVACAVGEWLVTHAGLSPARVQRLGLVGLPACEIADALNQRFEAAQVERVGDSTIESAAEVDGGIMWIRFEHLLQEYIDAE
ncbi:MAG: hypothetical protein H7287_03015 [Thermoleophilia bacterium]|nr:hypothetical protein [Thermoleophilia bacterium]